MTGESIGSVPQNCPHRWKKVGGTDRPDGSYDVICDGCGSTQQTKKLKVEQTKDRRPILNE
jgi:hypothetical protein